MKTSILIPDGEAITLRNVVSGLSQKGDIRIFVMSYRKCSMRFSRHIHNYSVYPKPNNELVWIDNINKELEKHDINLIMPIFIDGIETILKHKEQIPFYSKLCLLPEFKNFNIANNKDLFAEHLFKNNLPFPKSILIDPNNYKSIYALHYPVVIKPVKSVGGGTGISLFNNPSDFEPFITGVNNWNVKYLAQEYTFGYDVGCSVLCKAGNVLAYTIQKVTLNDTNPFAPLLGAEFIYEKEIYDIIKKLIKSLDWSGVAHIDLRFDEKSNQVKIIEMNPRYWGSVESSLIAGINFPYLHCLASLGRDFVVPEYKRINYLNLKGLAKSVKKNAFFMFRFNFLFKNTPIKFILKDPLSNIPRLFPKRKNNYNKPNNAKSEAFQQ